MRFIKLSIPVAIVGALALFAAQPCMAQSKAAEPQPASRPPTYSPPAGQPYGSTIGSPFGSPFGTTIGTPFGSTIGPPPSTSGPVVGTKRN
jgi:hypothetical protein